MTQIDSEYDDLTEDEEEDDGASLPSKLRRELRKKDKALKEAEAKAQANESAARRVAFLDANIPDTPQTRYFRDRYDGPLDAEAIKAEAIANGFLEQEDTTAEIAGIESDTERFVGGQQATDVGGLEDFQAEVDKAVAKAKPGQENRAIADVVARFQRSVG